MEISSVVVARAKKQEKKRRKKTTTTESEEEEREDGKDRRLFCRFPQQWSSLINVSFNHRARKNAFSLSLSALSALFYECVYE
jgi:hypothetical protein